MKKIVVAVVALFMGALLFWAGGHYGQEPSVAGTTQDSPVYAADVEGQENTAMPLSPGAVKITPARRQLIGVKVAEVEKKPMTYTLRLYGRVVPDETRIFRVNASTDCWIRQISDVTTGSIVQKDEILAEALAPAYYNAQLTYLIALDNIDRIKQQLGGQLRHQQLDLSNNQIRMAVQSLQNLGITDAQTEELANTRQARPYLQVRSPSDGVVLSRKLTLRQWFKAAEEFYTIADLGKVWVYADVYEDEAMHMRPGMAVTVRHAQMGKTFAGRVAEVIPLFDPGARTLKAQIEVDNSNYDLRPDMFVDVEIPITMPASVNVSADAVLDAGTRAIVYVDAGDGAFEPRRVETGWRLGSRIEIIGGLLPGEKVAVSGNFLIDSESKMEIAAMGPDVRMRIDPVCGRYVDAQEAEMVKMSADYEGETFYFHSDECKSKFEKEPEKYLPKAGKERATVVSAVMSGKERTWADLLDPVKGKRVKKSRAGSIKVTKDSPLRRYSTTPEVVNWKRPPDQKEDPKWARGWGGFPGAKYLGIKNKSSSAESSKDKSSKVNSTKADSSKAADAVAPSSESPEAVAKKIDEELKALEKFLETEKQQVPDQPRPDAK